MLEENVQGTEQQGGETPAGQDNGTQQAKTFTQDEVTAIVEKRLARERRKLTGVLGGTDPREADLDERERAASEREMRLDAREELEKRGLPQAALELLNYNDKESCGKSIDALEKVIRAAVSAAVADCLKGGRPIKAAPQGDSDPIRAAFGL